MKKNILAPLLFAYLFASSQDVIKVYPSSWWVGLNNPRLQLMLHGTQIGKLVKNDFQINYPGVMLEGIQKVKSPNYIFLNLLVSPQTEPGNLSISCRTGTKKSTFVIPLNKMTPGNGKKYAQGVNSSDFIYLIMPDRFSNGDPANDRFHDMSDTVVDRKNPLARHGGDIQGVTNHFDYLQQLGVTTIWLTPVIVNDMPLEKESAGMVSGYHGYWFTDHYEIDRRMGGKEAYLKMVQAAHAHGMKVIQDAVYNHIGAEHWFMKDPPGEDWINQWPQYQNTSHREQSLFDVHASEKDRDIMEGGWFVPHLPDLNLKNPLLQTYLIQQAIWMTETFQLDGWRVDTYKYCDPVFLNKLNAALEKQFPALTSLGEATVNSVAAGAYFCRNNLNVSWKSNLTGILDFPVCDAMLDAAKNKSGWTTGLNHLYVTLAEDMLYKEPMNNCIFLDNHDRDRFYSVVNENWNNFQIGIGLLLTMRGIPHLYYGTEILMKNFKNPSDAMVREDFPGGFAGDPDNKFLATGRSASENAAFDYVSKLAKFRKSSDALKYGKLMQYVPANNLYTYFRYSDRQTILCTINADTIVTVLNSKDFSERTRGYAFATDIMTGQSFSLANEIEIPARSIRILELKK